MRMLLEQLAVEIAGQGNACVLTYIYIYKYTYIYINPNGDFNEFIEYVGMLFIVAKIWLFCML